jgi:uncharacterized protein (TIGR03086 family)
LFKTRRGCADTVARMDGHCQVGHSLVEPAAAPLAAIIATLPAERLDAPTPCREYDVRGLLNHLLFWGPSLVAAADKKLVAPPADSENGVDLIGANGTGGVAAHLDDLVAAWRRPDAWTGTAHVGGPTPLPAPMVGGMVLGELVVHGWDLARAVGRDVHWEPDVLDLLYAEVARTAEQGRAMRVYGDPVPVPDDAPMLARVLGLTGRDPDWTPS